MNLAALIIETYKTRLADDPRRLGFRLSPIAISKADALELAAAADSLDDGLHLVVSAPDLPVVRRARVFMAPDERAAEQATAWRNSVRPAVGQHLLYVSAEEHDKASGLADVLAEIRDEDLAHTFATLSEYRDSGLPQGLGQVLGDSGILDRVAAGTLCDFARAVRRDVEKAGGRAKEVWEAVGQNLPIVSLAKDTGLRRANAKERLFENQRLVTRAAAAERRRHDSASPTADIESTLRQSLAGGSPQQRSRALREIDLGDIRTPQLKRKPKTRTSERGATAARRRRSPDGREEEVSVTPSSTPVQPLGPGLAAILGEVFSSDGSPLEWAVRAEPRQCLAQLPGGAQFSVTAVSPAAELVEPMSRWRSARTHFIASLLEQHGADAVALLVRSPERALSRSALIHAASAFVDASTDLFRAAHPLGLSEAQLSVLLSLDTVTLRDPFGPALIVIGPLHSLWLYQALLTAGALREAGKSDLLAHSLLRRALETPAAPPVWPTVDGPSLHLGRAESNLPVYQRNPDSVAPSTLKDVGKSLLTRHLEIAPHAHLGMRVAVVDGDASELVAGMAEVLLDDKRTPRLRRLEVATSKSPTLSQTTADAQASGNLLLTSLPLSEDAIFATKPHIVIRFAPAVPGPDNAVPGTPSATADAGGGLLRTQFSVDAHGLQARTSLAGHPALEALEEVHARARRRTPRKEFVTEARAVSLASVLPVEGSPATTWHVALGARLGGQAPPEHRLLVHEAIDASSSCAIATREVRPAARAIADGLKDLGISEDRPKVLVKIANRLAGGSSAGLLALRRDGVQLIAAGVLALELQRRLSEIGPTVVARVDGAYYTTIVGEPPERDSSASFALAMTAEDDGVRLTIGYASLNRVADIRTERKALLGRDGKRISRVIEACRRVSDDDAIGGAAREALSWFLWPAVASQGLTDARLVAGLHAWAGGSPVTSTALCILPAGVLAGRERSVSIGPVPVSFQAFDHDLVNRLVLQD